MYRESMEIEDFTDFIEEELLEKVWFITTKTGRDILKDKGVI